VVFLGLQPVGVMLWCECVSGFSFLLHWSTVIYCDVFLVLAVIWYAAVGPLLFDGIGLPQRLLSTGSPLPQFESSIPTVSEVISHRFELDVQSLGPLAILYRSNSG
jgi:hypothetical protein